MLSIINKNKLWNKYKLIPFLKIIILYIFTYIYIYLQENKGIFNSYLLEWNWENSGRGCFLEFNIHLQLV